MGIVAAQLSQSKGWQQSSERQPNFSCTDDSSRVGFDFAQPTRCLLFDWM